MRKENEYTKVSIITVSYNAVGTIEQTILSVVNQTYSNIEYIIIDGGSTDGTIDIIKKYQDKITYWVSESDNGIYDAMNKGINIANGEIIGIINADDWYEKNAIEISVNNLLKNEELDGICGDIFVYMECSKCTLVKRICSSTSLNLLKNGMTIMHPTVFLKKRFYYKYGNFNTEFRIAADYDLMLRASLNGANIKYIPMIISHFRLGGTSGDMRNTNIDLMKIRNKYNLTIETKTKIKNFIQFGYAFVCDCLPEQIIIFIKINRGWLKARYHNDTIK